MNDLGQYFTANIFSNLLIENINKKKANVIVDLGIGDGSLTNAAIRKWEKANYYGVDIDNSRLSNITKKLPNVNLYNCDSLDLNLNEKIQVKLGSVDIALCNPPYLNLKKEKNHIKILENASLLNSINLKSYTTDLIFLAQNINFLKNKGTLGIILPEGIICGYEFKLLRKDIIENHSLEMVIELESGIFSKTEAKTYIVILTKGKSTTKKGMLCFANKSGRIKNKIFVNKECLVERMDFKFHSSKIKNIRGKSLKDLGVTINRGSFPNHTLKQFSIPYFHTTDFKHFNKYAYFENNSYYLKSHHIIAKRGDILLGRVGRNNIKQVLMVKSGNIVITDCVYRIRIPQKYREVVFKKLISQNGKSFLLKITHGVCAQVINKNDLEQMKVQL